MVTFWEVLHSDVPPVLAILYTNGGLDVISSELFPRSCREWNHLRCQGDQIGSGPL